MIDTTAILITCGLTLYVLLRYIKLDWQERYTNMMKSRDRVKETQVGRS